MLISTRVDERALAEAACYYSRLGRLPRTKSGLIRQIMEDFVYVLRTNDRTERVSTIQEGISILEGFRFADNKAQENLDLESLSLEEGAVDSHNEDLQKALGMLYEPKDEEKKDDTPE